MLQDQVMSIVLLILVQNYINIKERKKETEMINKVSQYSRQSDQDKERKELIALVTEGLSQNQSLRDNTYYTLMLIAFEKKRVSEMTFLAIPQVDEVLWTIKNVKLRQDNTDEASMKNATSTFDIDFFFIVLEQFMRYHLSTKQVFLTHIQAFLNFHQHAFMLIFEEVNVIEASFKTKLLSFFHLIISECIQHNKESEVSQYAQNIILDVCAFQFQLTGKEGPDLMTSIGSFVSHSGSFSAAKGRSDYVKLGKQDFDGLKLMKEIFMFFKNESN